MFEQDLIQIATQFSSGIRTRIVHIVRRVGALQRLCDVLLLFWSLQKFHRGPGPSCWLRIGKGC